MNLDQYQQQLMINNFCKISRNVLRKFDLFSTSQLIRYRQSSQFGTAVGGLISLGVMVTFIILFGSRGLKMLNRQIIYSSISYEQAVEPSPATLQTSPDNGFMFSVGIFGLDLNHPNISYFNVTLVQSFYSPIYDLINQTQISMVPCTAEHFNFNSDINQLYSNFKLNHSLCPPLGFSFEVGGRVTSEVFSQLSVHVKSCNNTINPKCVSQAELEAIQGEIGYFTLITPIVNTLVNAQDQKYINQYFEDSNYFYFTSNSGLNINAEIQQFQINTDISLLPTEDIVTEYAFTVPKLFSQKSIPVFNNGISSTFVQLNFVKSSTSTIFSRSFLKVDAFLAYVGGFISMFLGFFSVLSSYSEAFYIISIASDLFTYQQQKQPFFSFKKFTIFNFILMYIKEKIDYFCFSITWKQTDTYNNVVILMQRQLDLSYMIKKIIFLEQAISSILPQHQIAMLYLSNQQNLLIAESNRKRHIHATIYLFKM